MLFVHGFEDGTWPDIAGKFLNTAVIMPSKNVGIYLEGEPQFQGLTERKVSKLAMSRKIK